MAAAASSFSERVWKYDVFLNFRGKDTRRAFIGHLYKGLDEKKISTFIDAKNLRKGGDLSELLTHIQESRLSIVVFSKSYVTSSWCLKELVHIMKCMDTKKQMVVPIFYQVDASHIRKLKGNFEEKAFLKGKHHPDSDMNHNDSGTDANEVERWKCALRKAANIVGWDSTKYDNEAVFIAEIVQDIWDRLAHISYKRSGLVEMDFQVKNVNDLLCLDEKDDVRVIGIWGMGGIGKTSIAKAVYEEIASQFDASCFLDNVKEGFMKQGAVYMVKQLLSRILNEKGRKLVALNTGSKKIMERLGSKKLFVVLDDVDSLDQIETLLGTERSFGVGSRIIIATRNMELLRGADATYKPKLLSDDGALKLLKQYAFRTPKRISDYRHLEERALIYARGLPLALKVLGAFLDGKTVHEWEAVLEKTKNVPHMGIHDVLKTSFDGLDDSEKEIFLDIACFFKGLKKDHRYTTKVLHSCGFFPQVGLRVLVDRALLTISLDGTLEMHDSLVEMGREIVRQESIKQPGKRSRLWRYEDVLLVLTQNTATEAVESITLDLSNSKEVRLNTEAFGKMKNLRLLNIKGHSNSTDSDGVISHEDLKVPSDKLSCLLWHRCPLRSFQFSPNNLVDLDMQYSRIENLWEGIKPLEKLELVNLSHCEYLTKTPDFTEAKNLEKLILDGCTCLLEVHTSISALENLVFLSLKECREVKIFPSSICMRSLKTLNLSGCSNLQKFPEIQEPMEALLELYLDGTGIKELPLSIENLTGLVTFNLEGCQELVTLPSIIPLRSLKFLKLSGCSRFEKFPEVQEVTKKLSKLYLDRTAIKELSASIKNLKGLTILDITDCIQLERMPMSIVQIRDLTVSMSGCIKLKTMF